MGHSNSLKLVLLSTLLFVFVNAAVNRNSNIMTTVSQINAVVNSINFNTPQHIQKLQDAVVRTPDSGYVPNTIVNFIVKATPSTAYQKNSEIEASISATNGACRLLTTQWKILQDGRFYTNFFMASLKCNSDAAYQSLAGNSNFYSNVAGGNLATALTDPLDSDIPVTVSVVAPYTPPPPTPPPSSCSSQPNRVAVWQGKVNQHTDEYGYWQTDPDGSSGAELDLYYYCLKFYPSTSYVQEYGYEYIYGWRDAGNYGGPYGLTVMTYECVCDNYNYYKKDANNQTSAEKAKEEKIAKLREEFDRIVAEAEQAKKKEERLRRGLPGDVVEGEEEQKFEERTNFYGQFDLDCGIGSAYSWVEDFAADGQIDCRTTKTDPQCKVIKDEGATGIFYLMDTGVYRSHNEFASRRWNPDKFQTICVLPDYDDSDPLCHEDTHSHGTSIAAYLVGDTLGLAKQAKLISMKVRASDTTDTIFEAAVLKSFQIVTDTYQASYPRKPTMLVTAQNIIFEKAPCGWKKFDPLNPAKDPAVCGVQIIIEMLNMISKGIVVSSPITNGWRNDRDFGQDEFMDVGYDICRYADFDNLFDADPLYYYPMYSVRGDETWGTSGIRPFRFASIDHWYEISRVRNLQTDGTTTLFDTQASCWGNDGWCLDYGVPGFNLPVRAVVPTVLEGGFEPYCYDNPYYAQTWCTPTDFDNIPGKSFSDGYIRTPFKSSATSWATGIGGAMLMSYMIENWGTLQYLDLTMSQQLRNFVDAALPKDYYGNVQKTTVYNWYNVLTHNGFTETFNNIYKSVDPYFNYEDYTPASTAYPSYKMLFMSPVLGSKCRTASDWPKTRISVWQGKVNQHTDPNYGYWETDQDGSSGAELDKLTYCRKFYPGTIAVKDWAFETIYGWRDAGNTGGPYQRNWWTYECVQPEIHRIAKWQGKVNQHTDQNGVWSTDSDGYSGAEIGDLQYCRKFWPFTVRTYNYKQELIPGWRDAGNSGGPYQRSLTSIVCDAEGQRIHNAQTGSISLVLDGVLRGIPNPGTYNNLFFSPWSYQNHNQYWVNNEAQGQPLLDGAYLMRAYGTAGVYFVDNCGGNLCKRGVTSPAAMNKYGFRDAAVRGVYQWQIDSMMSGPNINA